MDKQESAASRFITGASVGAVAGAVGSIWTLNELDIWVRKSPDLMSKSGLKIVLGSTVAAAVMLGLLNVATKDSKKRSWEERLEPKNTATPTTSPVR